MSKDRITDFAVAVGSVPAQFCHLLRVDALEGLLCVGHRDIRARVLLAGLSARLDSVKHAMKLRSLQWWPGGLEYAKEEVLIFPAFKSREKQSKKQMSSEKCQLSYLYTGLLSPLEKLMRGAARYYGKNTRLVLHCLSTSCRYDPQRGDKPSTFGEHGAG